MPPPSRSSSVFTDQIKYYRLAIDGWDVVSEGGSFGQTQTAGGTVATHLRGPTLRTTLGSRKAVLDLNVGIGTVAPRVLPGAGAIIDERQSFHENRAFAATYFRAHALRAAGLHLLFLPSHTGRFSHLALTYWHQRAWVRRYSVILPDPLTGTSTEFAFIFRFSGPFNEFCRAVHRADAVVLSLQWPGPPVQAPPPDPPNFSSFDPELLLEAARAKAWKSDAFFTAFDWFRSAFDRLNLTPVGRFGAAQQLKPLVNGLEHTLPHKAIAVTCEVLALLPEDARTWRFGASVLVRLGRYADAERCADRAVEASDPQERGRSWTFLADCRRERALRDPTLSSELRHRKLMSAREAARQAINLGDGYGAQMLEQAEQALRRFESEARR